MRGNGSRAYSVTKSVPPCPQAGPLHAGLEGASAVDPVLAVHLVGDRRETVVPLVQDVAQRLEVDAVLRTGGEDAPVVGVHVQRVPVQQLVGPLVVGLVDHGAVVDEPVRVGRLDHDVVVLVAAELADPQLRPFPLETVIAVRVADARLRRVARSHVPHAELAVHAQHRPVQAGTVALPRVFALHHRLGILLRLMPHPLYPDVVVDQAVVEEELAVAQVSGMGFGRHRCPPVVSWRCARIVSAPSQSGMSNTRCRLPPWIRRRSSCVM